MRYNLKNFFIDSDFNHLMSEHIKENLDLLLAKNKEFAILVNITEVEFEPKLPAHIQSSFKPLTLFAIAGYTFETFEIYDDYVLFEAGFGEENFGSVLKIPYHCIIQIIVDDTPIFINLSRKIDPKKQQSKVKRSQNIFLSNPENQKYLKKRK